MNQLSWLLYFGDVAGNIGVFCGWTGLVVLAVAIVNFIVYLCTLGYSLDYENRWAKDIGDTLKASKTCRVWAGWLTVLAFGIWFVGLFLPSQNTVYAIAASEMGGKLLNSETGNLADQALNAWLKRQINSPAPSNTQQ